VSRSRVDWQERVWEVGGGIDWQSGSGGVVAGRVVAGWWQGGGSRVVAGWWQQDGGSTHWRLLAHHCHPETTKLAQYMAVAIQQLVAL